jgi:hypothetical protein
MKIRTIRTGDPLSFSMPRRFGLILGLGVVYALLSSPVLAAPLTLANMGFEEGLTGWTVEIQPRYTLLPYAKPDGVGQTYANVVSSHQGDDPQAPIRYEPVEGNRFLEINAKGNYGDALWVGVFQKFTAGKGDTLSGYAAFDARENDSCISVLEFAEAGVNCNVVYFTNVPEVGSHGDEPWTKWEWTAPRDGSYMLYYKLTNPLLCDKSSYAVFDAVPIPPALFLFGTGLAGLAAIRRKPAA